MANALTRKTGELLPRNSCHVYSDSWDSNNKILFDPLSELMGDQLRFPPEEIGRRLAASRRMNLLYYEQESAGTPPYKKYFHLPERLLKANPKTELMEEFREIVKKKYGSYSLADSYPHEAISYFSLLGPKLLGNVKSKEFRKGIGGYYGVTIDTPFLDGNGFPEIASVVCQDGGQFHIRADKGARTKDGKIYYYHLCPHSFTLLNQFREWCNHRKNPRYQRKGPEIEDPESLERHLSRGLFTPYSFPNNWKFRDGKFYADDPNLASLEDDARIAYLTWKGEGSGYFHVNRMLFTIPETLSPMFNKWAQKGRIRREAVVHGRKVKNISKNELEMENHVMLQLRRIFHDNGCRHNGYAVEMSKVGWIYENDKRIYTMFRCDEGIFYTIREKNNGMGPINPTGQDNKCQSPLESYWYPGYKRRHSDLLMRETDFSLEIPSAVRLRVGGKYNKNVRVDVPEMIRRKWKKGLSESKDVRGSGKIIEKKLKRARLFL